MILNQQFLYTFWIVDVTRLNWLLSPVLLERAMMKKSPARNYPSSSRFRYDSWISPLVTYEEVRHMSSCCASDMMSWTFCPHWSIGIKCLLKTMKTSDIFPFLRSLNFDTPATLSQHPGLLIGTSKNRLHDQTFCGLLSHVTFTHLTSQYLVISSWFTFPIKEKHFSA